MNIAVIGSGATGFGVLLRLKELLKIKNVQVTVFSKDLNHMNEIFLKNRGSNQKELNLS